MFPPVDWADENGLLCYGGELSAPVLIEAYQRGIFPWPHEGFPLLWFAPPQRGVLFLDELRVSRRARRAIRAANFTYKMDANFAAVIRACALPREYSDGTWINEEIIEAYEELHRLGIAHSVETYQGEVLVGGLYGVSWGAYFCGESMFHFADHASKAALIYLAEYLQERGATWIDCQLLTPFFETMGAREIPREEFMQMLQYAWNAATIMVQNESE
jgi:leucyl/phenylalanyl-tRNA--protein transferase